MTDKWDMSELDGMDAKLETKSSETKTATQNKVTARGGKKLKKNKRRMSMMSQLEAQMDEDEDAASVNSSRRKGKNRRMSTNVTAAQMAMQNRQSGTSQHVDVYLLDGTDLSISITAETKTRHALLMIKDLIQLENDADFGLFELRGGFAVGTYHIMNDEATLLDVIEDWNKKQQDPKFLAVGDPEKRLGNDMAPRHLVLKRRLYLPWSPLHHEIKNATSIEDTAHKLEYIECIHHVMYSRYPVSKDRAVKIAALMLQMELGDWTMSKYPKVGSLKKYMLKFLPKYTLEGRKINKYEQRAVKEWKQLGGYTPLEAQQSVLEQCKFWFPWYGCEFFRIDYQRKKEDAETRGHMLTGITVAIGHGGLHFLYRTHGAQKKIQPRMLLASHKYATIDKWITAKSGKVFSFYLGKSDLCFVVNPQSSYIETLVREYIFEFMEVTEMMKNKKNGTDGATDVAKSPARSRQAASTKSDDPDGSNDESESDAIFDAKRIAVILSGSDDAVRIPYDRFVQFYSISGFSNTPEAFLNATGQSRAPKSAVSCQIVIDLIKNLNYSRRQECLVFATKSGEITTPSLPKGWEMVEDEESGKSYYVHSTSGASQWTVPGENDSAETDVTNPMDAWIEVEDPSTGKVYFFNENTGETSWHPNGGEDEPDEEEPVTTTASRRSSMAFAYDNRERSSTGNLDTLIEGDEDDNENKEDEEDDQVDQDDEDEDIDLGGNEWASMTDESTGQEYYVNNLTGESQWEMPDDAWTQHDHDGRLYWVNSITGESRWEDEDK